MPGWYEKVRDLVESKKLVMLGVVQEQHAERTQLFANWKEFDFPILHDPINQLGCNAVPITIAIDRQGIVRNKRPTPDWVRNELVGLSKSTDAVGPVSSPMAAQPSVEQLQATARARDTSAAWRDVGDAIMLWAPQRCAAAIDTYQKSLALGPSPELHFRLGVAYRHRSESDDRQLTDFSEAVDHWSTALRQNPNQYIWRRRIQQYGPRLDKPYPFYDWVDEAVVAITERDGKPPAPLRVPLSGAEIAKPAGQEPTATVQITEDSQAESPDPENRIYRDTERLVTIAPTVVADSRPNQEEYRLHLQFSLSDEAVWNNESEPVQVWFEETAGVTMRKRRLRHRPTVTSAESHEVRVLDVEFAKKHDSAPHVQGFALYTICVKATGQCILRRQDFTIPIRID